MSEIIEDFSVRLNRAMNIRNLKPVDLVEKTGIDKSKISSYMSGRYKAKQDGVYLLAKALDVDEAWLMGLDVPMLKSNKSFKTGIKIPVLGSIPAGIPLELIEDILDYEEISESMIKGDKKYFALKVKGKSMEPEYRDGDILIVLQTETCESGDDCIVRVNGNEGTFKRVLIQDNGITLQPLNNQFQPLFYSKRDINNLPIKILGIVVEVRRKIRR